MRDRTSCATIRPLLSAHVDGELTADESIDVMEHLTTCATCSQEYETMLAAVATLRDALPSHPAPDVLRGRVRNAVREASGAAESTVASRRTPTIRWPSVAQRMAVAGLLLLGAGLGAGATLLGVGRSARSSVAVPNEILASHIRSLMPGHLMDIASSDQHNVKPWFNGRLDYSPVVARVDSAGFPLLGGRLDYASGRPVAAVVYGRRQHVINVFSWPVADAGDTPVGAETRQGYNMLHWRHGGIEYWVVSDLNASELAEFAALLRARGAGPSSGQR
ncbi:MAG TPA: anti-sigma factor [Candidatus Elarobacter sp.]|nr:anti-sigma factor [Candidatus Elarobacter sp.]